MDVGVGILPDDPQESVLRRILCATPWDELSTTFTGPRPLVSDDAYVRVELEVVEWPAFGRYGGKLILRIFCGDQGMGPTNATDQSSLGCGE